MTQCPDHPRTLGAQLNACRECQREADAIRHLAEERAAAVRAAIQSAPKPPAARDPKPTPRDLDDVRRKADQEAGQ